jgi:hypothetical protein
MKMLWLIALLALMGAAQAETSAAKKELVAKVLQLQQPAIEQTARALAERPAVLVMQQAGRALQARVAADKREALGKEIQADVRKYVDEAVPLVRDNTQARPPPWAACWSASPRRTQTARCHHGVAVNRKFAEMGGK